MEHQELITALRLKTVEFETAMETGRPREELMRIYKELKVLRYKILEAEIEKMR